jgi:hypothetical protein
MKYIRITSTPPGEAPLAIREAWIGVELPLASEQERLWLGKGVLTGPHGRLAELFHLLTFRMKLVRGFAVSGKKAVETLERTRPEAALWWREHTPHFTEGSSYMLFPDSCCERVR